MSQPRVSQSLARRVTFPLTHMSIEQRLPLLVGTLLFGVILTSVWASYRGVRESALEVGRERLLNLTQQLAALTQQSHAAMSTKTLTAANEPAIHAYLQTPSLLTKVGALTTMNQFAAPIDPAALQLELWNNNRNLAMTLPEGELAEPADLTEEFKQSAVEPFRVIGMIRQVKDAVAYPIVVAVKGDQANVIGYFVRWRKITATPEARKQLTDLLGSQAVLYYGNRQGNLWTDLVKLVTPPPETLRSNLDFTHYLRDGVSVMALGRPIGGTPWYVVVEFPDQILLVGASHFLRRMSLIGFALLMVGLAGVFVLSRTITRPLQSLTEAASGMSAGNYSRIVDIRRNDELGALAKAFNQMVGEVRDSRQELESKVQERTAQLAAANKELAAFSDLTSQGLREKSLELEAMTQQMWQASKLATMGELAASIAHELNNPLATLALRSESLLEQLPADDPKRRGVEIIDQEVERMATLVGGLLEFSRRGHRQVSTVDSAEEITNSVNFIAYYLRNRNVKVVTEFDDDVPTVQADRQQLRQLFLNLLTNACDAMPKGGTIITRARRGQLNGKPAVLFEVVDTGIGIAPADLERIWDSFFTTKPEGKGTGLGLAICRRIVEEHGGKIGIESRQNQGTTVSVTLPATANEKSAKTEAAIGD